MLAEKEKLGIQSMLKVLTSEQLKSLAVTLSKGQIVCNSDEECTKAVLAFENSGEEFLRRRVISKKIVLQYAVNENLKHISDCRTKEDVMRVVLKHWSESDVKQVEQNSATSSPTGPATNQTSNTFNILQVNFVMPSNSASSETYEQGEDYQFGETFCNWFFKMLNNPDPVSQGFGPLHFMPHAQMFTNFVSPGNTTENSYSNSNDISNVLLDLSKNLRFNPNISPGGMKIKSDPHGLKLVLVCGTLFNTTSLCGTFQQSFGLVKDPNAQEKWKIQVTALKCCEVQGPVEPRFDETAIALENVTIESLKNSLVHARV